jgi:two-component system invasion response regulator UvrY
VTVKVLLVDDHHLVRTGLRRIIDGELDLEVAAEAATGEEALKLTRTLAPDVVLMDLNMPGMGGMEAARLILGINPAVKVLGVSVHLEGAYPRRFLEAGCHGYLNKGCSAEELIAAIRAVAQGRRYISHDVAHHLAMEHVGARGQLPLEALTQREMQVLRLLAQGRTVHEVAADLHINVKTVYTYRHRLQTKLDARSAVELTHVALRHGLIDGGDLP